MVDFLASLAARAPASIVGWRGGEPVSLRSFLGRVSAWRALAARTPGTALAIYFDDSVEFGAALLGSWQAGKTVWLTADTLDASCAALAASVDAFFGQFPARCQPLAPQADDCCDLPWRVPGPDFAAVVVHTSGSSGKPQAIAKRLAQLTSEVATLEDLFGQTIGTADVIATVSHQHIYGLLFKVLWPLAAGRAIHARSLDYPEQMAQMLGLRPCILVASPAHLKRLPAHLDWRGAASMLRAVFCSGGPLAAQAGAAAGRLLGRTPVEVYGSSETGGIAWRQPMPGEAPVWTPLPGVQWRADGQGQLEVRSAHLERDAWLGLADRVEAAGPGHFLLLGRSDRIAKIEEKRVSLDVIELTLMASGLASEARVVLCPQQGDQRQALAAVVVLSAPGRALLAAAGKHALNARLREHLAGVVEAVAMPRRWRYPDQMPLNAQGKTTEAQLLALLEPASQVAVARPREPHSVLLEQSAQRLLFAITVPASLVYLDGHFPQDPIVPGVVLVDWAIYYGRRHFSLAPAFEGINALKFEQVVLPEQPLCLELAYDAARGSLQFRYFSDAGTHAGGRILFATPT